MTTAAPPTSINTTKVPNRRKLRFNSLDEILADVDTLAQSPNLQHLGNWTPGQILTHLATTMTCSIDGFPTRMPAPVRLLMRVFFKRRLLKTSMSPGFNLPKSAAAYMIPPATTLDDGLAKFRKAHQRLQSEAKRSPSPFLGPLTHDQWTQLHCRHAELHLSFLVPA